MGSLGGRFLLTPRGPLAMEISGSGPIKDVLRPVVISKIGLSDLGSKGMSSLAIVIAPPSEDTVGGVALAATLARRLSL